MPFKTVALGAALTPTVISTCFSHVSDLLECFCLGVVPIWANGLVRMIHN